MAYRDGVENKIKRIGLGLHRFGIRGNEDFMGSQLLGITCFVRENG